MNRPDRQKIGTVGLPLPGVAVRIADDGEVLIHGKTVFPGYWQNEEATAETFTDDGWFRSGDIGELDDEGFLSITGRKKEMIVTAGGKNVAPAVLEDRLRSHADHRPGHGGRGRAAVRRRADHDRPRGVRAVEGAARQAGRRDRRRPARRPGPGRGRPGARSTTPTRRSPGRSPSASSGSSTSDFTQEQGHLSAKLGIRRVGAGQGVRQRDRGAVLLSEGYSMSERRRAAVRSQDQSRSTQARPLSPIARAVAGSVRRATSRSGQRAGVAAGDHVAGLALEDRVRGAARVAADHRQPGRRRLQVDDAEALHVEAAAPGPARHGEDVARPRSARGARPAGPDR